MLLLAAAVLPLALVAGVVSWRRRAVLSGVCCVAAAGCAVGSLARGGDGALTALAGLALVVGLVAGVLGEGVWRLLSQQD